MPGCIISRCQSYNYSSLFVRLWPGAYERARFAFLGPFALSVKGFSLLLCQQHGLNCIASEAFLTLQQGHRKYSSEEAAGRRGGAKKGGRKLTLEFPTSALSSETGLYVVSGINVSYSVPPIKLFKSIAYFYHTFKYLTGKFEAE